MEKLTKREREGLKYVLKVAKWHIEGNAAEWRGHEIHDAIKWLERNAQ